MKLENIGKLRKFKNIGKLKRNDRKLHDNLNKKLDEKLYWKIMIIVKTRKNICWKLSDLNITYKA
jgi:archaellum biogenesis protein FlaJ (TadC family)